MVDQEGLIFDPISQIKEVVINLDFDSVKNWSQADYGLFINI